MPLFPGASPERRPVVGMLHLLPLPGSPLYEGHLDSVRAALLKDAESLVVGGVTALLIENYGDAPFYPGRVPAETVSHMTALATEVRRRFDVPLGVNVLRNDGCSALAVAHAAQGAVSPPAAGGGAPAANSGGSFIRVNVLSGARVTDQGIVQGEAHEILRMRSRLRATTGIWADVSVKHSQPLGNFSLEDEARDLVERACADVLIVSGRATGHAAAIEELRRVKAIAGRTPVVVGSGVTSSNVTEYVAQADGFIIGTSFKTDGVTTRPVDPVRVRALLEKLRGAE